MRNKTLMIGVIGGIVIGVLLSTAVVFAGSLNPGSGPGGAGSQMFTLQQIYQRLTTGQYLTKQSAFTEPASGPGAGTMRTLDEIMAVAQPRALAPRVPKTGQTLCYDAAGAVIGCAGTGQDGEYQMGITPVVAPNYGSTISAFNTPAWTGVRFTDNGDGTVTDNLTALTWLKNVSCWQWRDWTSALNEANGLAAPSCGLSDGSIAGQWRLPNANELYSLVDLNQSNPALPLGHPFDLDPLVAGYWTSTTDPRSGFTTGAQVVLIANGDRNSYSKFISGNFGVWPVRGGQ